MLVAIARVAVAGPVVAVVALVEVVMKRKCRRRSAGSLVAFKFSGSLISTLQFKISPLRPLFA